MRRRGFVRRKRMGGVDYHQLVRSTWDREAKRVVQVHLASLGEQPSVGEAIMCYQLRLNDLRDGEERTRAYLERRIAELEPFRGLAYRGPRTRTKAKEHDVKKEALGETPELLRYIAEQETS